MVVIVKKEDGYPLLINTDYIVHSFKRENGYGLLMDNKSEVWLTWKEFDQLKIAIEAGSRSV